LVLCSVLAAALAGAVPSIPALAATAPGTPAQTFAQPANAALHENAVEIHDFEQVPISLRQAITTAEAASRAKAVDARFAVENGAPFYDIKTFGNGALWEGRIDARTGQILGTPLTTPQARLSDGQLTQLHWLEDTGAMPLRRAVAIAEQQGGGKAINSVAISHQGKLAYATELVKNGTLERISIDPQNGRILARRAIRPGGTEMGSGSSLPPAPTATLPNGDSTDKSLGVAPPGASLENSPPK